MNNFLYALQTTRESWGAFLNPLMIGISEFAYYGIIIIVFLLYVCVDKNRYFSLALSYSFSNFAMNIFKLIACVYRPWISDDRLYPHKAIAKSASGYSFPSGHTTGAATFYGTLALNEKRNKNRTWLEVVLILLAVLTAFSRNWLGAHSLKDTVVGLILGFACIAITECVLKWINNNPSKDYILLIANIVFIVVALVYFSTKSYPIEYAADGTILADPLKMQEDAWLSCGMLLGLVLCWFIDRRYINFTTNIPTKYKVIRGVILLVMFALLYMVILKQLVHISPLVGSFLRSFLSIFICVGIYPAIFTKWEKSH